MCYVTWGRSRKWGLAQDWELAGGRGGREIGYPHKSYLEGGGMKPGSGWEGSEAAVHMLASREGWWSLGFGPGQPAGASAGALAGAWGCLLPPGSAVWPAAGAL